MLIDYDNQKNIILFIFPSKLISKEILLKCLYWYSSDYEIDYSELHDENIVITLKPKNNRLLTESEFIDVKNKLNQDIIDFSLRQIVTNETRNIRDLLIAKAFKPIE